MKNWGGAIIMIGFVIWIFYNILSGNDDREVEVRKKKRQDSIDRMDPENGMFWNMEDICLNAYSLNINPDTAIAIMKYYEINTSVIEGRHNVDSVLQLIFKKYPNIEKAKISNLILKCDNFE